MKLCKTLSVSLYVAAKMHDMPIQQSMAHIHTNVQSTPFDIAGLRWFILLGRVCFIDFNNILLLYHRAFEVHRYVVVFFECVQ